MTGAGLAEALRVDMGFPLPVSAQLLGWGTGVVEHIQTAAVVAHAAGAVTGTCPPPGGALTSGAAPGGTVSGMDGSVLANLVKTYAGYPSVTSQLQAFCDAIVEHLHSYAVVDFASSSITGTCTNTLLLPGPLTLGAGSAGTLSGLDGPTLADAVHAAFGAPGDAPEPLINFATGLVNYVMANASAAYADGGVTGTCPAGGGSLVAGSGAGGTVA